MSEPALSQPTFEHTISSLPDLYHATLVRTLLASQADHIPDELYLALFRFGREKEALNYETYIKEPLRSL